MADNAPDILTNEQMLGSPNISRDNGAPSVLSDEEFRNVSRISEIQSEDIQENLPDTPEEAEGLGLAHYLSKGFVSGMASTADLAPNLVVGAVRGIVELPYMAFNEGEMTGIEWQNYMDGYSKAANLLYDYVPESKNLDTKIPERVGKEIGSALGFMGIAGKVGSSLSQITSAGKLGEYARATGIALSTSIQNAPKATSAYTVASATGGGVGAEVGREMAPEGQETDYELAGLIIGSFSPDAVAAAVKYSTAGVMTRSLAKIPEYIRTKGASLESKLNQAKADFNQAKVDLEAGNIDINQYSKKHREFNNLQERIKVVKDREFKLKKHAADLLKKDLRIDSPEVQERLVEIHNLTKEIEGFSPTLGQSVGDLSPDIMATQKFMDNLSSPEAMNILEKNKEILREYAKRSFQTPTQKLLRTVFGKVGNRWTDLDRRLALKSQEYVDEAWEQSSIFRDNPSLNEIGSDLKDKLLESLARSNGRKSAIFNIDPEDKIKLQTKVVRTNIEKQVERWKNDPLSYPDEIPDYWINPVGSKPPLLDILKDNKQLTYNQLRSIEIRAGEEIRSLSAAQDKPASLKRKLGHLHELQQSVEFTLDKLSSGFGDVSKRYMTAKRWYKNKYVPAYLQGANKEILGVRLDGASRIELERIPHKIFTSEKGRNVAAAKQFNHVFGKDPEAQMLIEKTAMKMVEDFAFNRNTLEFNEERYFKWLSKHDDILSEFPTLKTKLLTTSDTLKTLASHKESVLARRDLLARSDARKYIGSDPDEALSLALSSPSEARRVIRSIEKSATSPEEMKEAKQAISHLIWDRVYGTGRPDNFIMESPELARNFITKHSESIKALMTDRDYRTLDSYLKALTHLKRTPIPTGQTLGQDVLEKQLRRYGVPSPASILSRSYAHAIGKVGKVYIIGDAATRVLSTLTRSHYNKIFKEALYDNELRETLLHFSQAERLTPEMARKFKYNLLNIGIVLTGDEEQVEE